MQCAEKDVSDSSLLLDFAGEFCSLLACGASETEAFGEFNYYRRTVVNIVNQKFFRGIV